MAFKKGDLVRYREKCVDGDIKHWRYGVLRITKAGQRRIEFEVLSPPQLVEEFKRRRIDRTSPHWQFPEDLEKIPTKKSAKSAARKVERMSTRTK